MSQKGPGKAHRNGISFVKLMKMFPDDDTAEKWFIEQRWSDGVQCPRCDSDNVQEGAKHPTMPFRCRSCRKFFSVKTGTVMQSSNLGYQVWALAIYLFNTDIKGVSSMKLHRDLDITQKTAWHLAHRIRESWQDQNEPLFGEIEIDETFVGGKEGNKHANKKLRAGRGTVGKTAVVGAKERGGNVVAVPVVATDRYTLTSFIMNTVDPDAILYTDENRAYMELWRDYEHQTVNHSVGEYVNEKAHTNGIESFWATLKRGYHGTYHQMSARHLHRYVNEFAGRANSRNLDTINQMSLMVERMEGARLTYRDLTR